MHNLETFQEIVCVLRWYTQYYMIIKPNLYEKTDLSHRSFFLLHICMEPEPPKLSSVDFYLQNGRLVFRNADAVATTLNMINTKSEQELDIWTKSLGNFTSKICISSEGIPTRAITQISRSQY